jgi:hypothetical protein
VWLDSLFKKKQGLFISVQPSHCLTIPLHLGSRRLKTLALLDFGAFSCFLDEEFTRLHKILIVKKLNYVHVEVINGRPLSSGDVTHKTAPLEVKFGNYSSFIIFNIIKIPSAPIILEFSWLERYNPHIVWKSRNIEFPIIPSLIKHTCKPLTKKSPIIKPFFY